MNNNEAVMEYFARIRTDKNLSISDIDDLSIISTDNHTLLQEAIVWRPELAIPLATAGSPVNHQDNNGQTALQYAISRSLREIVLCLMENGEKPNLLDKYGNNALWTAVMNPRPDYNAIAVLIEAGADFEHKNKAGRSPIDMARTKENSHLIDLFARKKIR